VAAVWCNEAGAQSRVEGVVRWADGSPASGLVVTIPSRAQTATTNAAGHYVFEAVAAASGPRSGRLRGPAARQTERDPLRVERIDFDLAGTASSPVPPPPVETATGQDIVIYAPDGTPIVSSEVAVTATLPMLSASTEAGKVRLSPEQVSTLPSLGTQDLFRALQWLPGISNNETSSGLFVRGGTPDQNLVDFDGFTVYSVDHLFGYFSAFNMAAVQSVDVSKGAYEPKFGGRLSSVTEVRSKSRPDRVRGSAGVSFLSADGVLELPLGSAASVLFAYRRCPEPTYDRILGS
jgi:hypothetical protein